MASEAVAGGFTTAEDRQRQKALDEARMAGAAAPAIDNESGKMINPHNPSFITEAPWYLQQEGTSLKHQKAWNKVQVDISTEFKRGTKGDIKIKYAKGACTNCGARTHDAKSCVERPRKIGAKWNNKDLMSDEHIEQYQFDWDSKRDRWRDFKVDDYKEVIEEFERVDQQRKVAKAQELQNKFANETDKRKRRKLRKKMKKSNLMKEIKILDSDQDSDHDSDSDSDSDSDGTDVEDLGERMKDFADGGGGAVVPSRDDRQRTITRNLRIREDTAKYLLNLDVNSAFYDPKSRSMRANPIAHLPEDQQAGLYKGENFYRQAGEFGTALKMQAFAWEAHKSGNAIHDLAMPTQAAKMYDVFKERKQESEKSTKDNLLDKYGGKDHMGVPKEIAYSQSEGYVEYARDGRVIKGQEKARAVSKYVEDICPGNHKSTWGSWYDKNAHAWGYKCCHQTLFSSYCLAEKLGQDKEIEQQARAEAAASSSAPALPAPTMEIEGDENMPELPPAEELAAAAAAAAPAAAGGDDDSGDADDDDSDVGLAGVKANKKGKKRKKDKKPHKMFGHDADEDEIDEEKLKEARKRLKKQMQESDAMADDRTRGYNSATVNCETTAEDLEAWREMRPNPEDPMAQFLTKN